jgi:hypothetical protein
VSKALNTNFLRAFWRFRGVRLVSYLVGFLLILGLIGLYLINFVVSRPYYNSPSQSHYHLRLLLSIDGQKINLGDAKYQTPYEKGQCDGSLTASPVHLHDGKDQYVHFHWQGLSGGQVLKNYGLNYVGGFDDVLGYNLSKITDPKAIKIFGKVLPTPKSGDNLYVYSGDENGYKVVSKDDFLNMDLELLLTKSQIRLNKEAVKTSFLEVNVEAHAGHIEVAQNGAEQSKVIGDTIGNLAVFVQDKEPSNDEIKAKFATLEPLPTSVCGG